MNLHVFESIYMIFPFFSQFLPNFFTFFSMIHLHYYNDAYPQPFWSVKWYFSTIFSGFAFLSFSRFRADLCRSHYPIFLLIFFLSLVVSTLLLFVPVSSLLITCSNHFDSASLLQMSSYLFLTYPLLQLYLII